MSDENNPTILTVDEQMLLTLAKILIANEESITEAKNLGQKIDELKTIIAFTVPEGETI